MADCRIFIRQEAFGAGYDVTVEPAPEGGNLNAEYPTHQAAFGYAVSLRATHGWSVVDLASGDHVADMLRIGGDRG